MQGQRFGIDLTSHIEFLFNPQASIYQSVTLKYILSQVVPVVRPFYQIHKEYVFHIFLYQKVLQASYNGVAAIAHMNV